MDESGVIRGGKSWEDVCGFSVQDTEVIGLGEFLGSASGDDLVYTDFSGFVDLQDDSRLVASWKLVGRDGVGQELVSTSFEKSVADLSSATSGIYLFRSESEGNRTCFAIVRKPQPGDDLIITTADQFARVFAETGMGKLTGRVWRGNKIVDASAFEELNEDSLVLDTALVSKIVENTVGYLNGPAAARLRDWGQRPKSAVLLEGPPGNGKTILSRICAKYALASDLNVILIEGNRRSRMSFDLESMGVGDQLRRGASHGPCLFVFEDIDLHCQTRDASASMSTERNSVLMDLLDFLDGVVPTDGYALIASTNRAEDLDPALLRSGRFDLSIQIRPPDARAREKLLEVLLKNGPTVRPDLSIVAELTDGLSFADMSEVIRRYMIAMAKESQLTKVVAEREIQFWARQVVDDRRAQGRVDT